MKKVYAVIHLKTSERAVENTLLAKEAGCDGVFLISHHKAVDVWAIYAQVRVQVAGIFIGVNDLHRGPMDTIYFLTDHYEHIQSPDALWFDNAGLDDTVLVNPETDETRSVAEEVRTSMKWDFKQTLIFGGVAFKHQPEVADVYQAALDAKDILDVVVTSGPETGVPPTVEKIKRMYEGCGDKLGIASGITPKNVRDYLPYAGHFLVATGISKGFYDLDLNLTKELVQEVGAG